MKKTFMVTGLIVALALAFIGCATTENGVELSNSDKTLAVINSFTTGDDYALLNYVSEDYIQHNLTFADGRQFVIDALPALAKAGTTVENIRSFEDGDYVILHTKYNLFGAGEQIGFDIFRFDNDKIVEHWITCSRFRHLTLAVILRLTEVQLILI